MSAKGNAVKQLRDEISRVIAGGDIDRAPYVHFLTLAAEQIEDWQLVFHESDAERDKYFAQAKRGEELIGNVGAMLKVAYRACAGELDANAPIEFACDQAPFKNLFATMYGLDSVGAELPKRRSKAKAAKTVNGGAK